VAPTASVQFMREVEIIHKKGVNEMNDPMARRI
jgi:hypothetical protein